VCTFSFALRYKSTEISVMVKISLLPHSPADKSAALNIFPNWLKSHSCPPARAETISDSHFKLGVRQAPFQFAPAHGRVQHLSCRAVLKNLICIMLYLDFLHLWMSTMICIFLWYDVLWLCIWSWYSYSKLFHQENARVPDVVCRTFLLRYLFFFRVAIMPYETLYLKKNCNTRNKLS
jgi:hypothetical protein